MNNYTNPLDSSTPRQKKWTAAEKHKLIELYPLRFNSEIAAILGRNTSSVKQKARKLGLVKPQKFIESGQFKKGQESKNKGKSQSEFMSPEGIQKTMATRFQKGSLPHNTKPPGDDIVIRKDKSGILYKYYRQSMSNWVLLQRHIWEQAHGKIPAKHLIVFIDGDTMNCQLSNLKMISMKENILRNRNATKAVATRKRRRIYREIRQTYARN